jgi:glycosyltransferase involved in cell wall biosynthesis
MDTRVAMSEVSTSAPLRQNTIVLCGPSMELGSAGYGGGKGGFVRNVAALLEHFSDGDLKMTLSPYSTRSFSRWWKFVLPLRLIADLLVFARNVRRGGAVHVMMTYGLAIYREFGMSAIATAARRPLILDIRGGGFVSWLRSGGWLRRSMVHWMFSHAAVILGQGVAVVTYLRPRYGDKVHHFPNFVHSGYLPPNVETRCTQSQLGVIFVGYCYAGKGVFELVEGCARAVQLGLSVRLTLVGAESWDFQAYLDNFSVPAGLSINRCGTLGFEEVQSLLASHDIFCFPSRHEGEGHPNAITEAMAHALVIVTTRHGFIPELLDNTAAYFVHPASPANLADTLVHIDNNREEARRKAGNARSVVKERYMEAHVLGELAELYRRTLRRA